MKHCPKCHKEVAIPVTGGEFTVQSADRLYHADCYHSLTPREMDCEKRGLPLYYALNWDSFTRAQYEALKSPPKFAVWSENRPNVADGTMLQVLAQAMHPDAIEPDAVDRELGWRRF